MLNNTPYYTFISQDSYLMWKKSCPRVLLQNMFCPSSSVILHCLSIFCLGRSKKKETCLNKELHPLEETETCPCDEFLSQPCGNWSACILPDPSVLGSSQGWMSHREVKDCGQGLRYRAVACINQQENLVSPSLCTESGRTNWDMPTNYTF